MTTNLDNYIESIKASKETMPPELYSFASNINHYELNHPLSLHDSWLASLNAEEIRNNERPFNSSLRITLKLLGQQHDCTLILSYSDVLAYEFCGKENTFNPNDTFHGDIVDHRVGIVNNAYSHTMEMRSGSVFKVVFRAFTFEVQRMP